MTKYKLVYWEIKERNFNKKDVLQKFASKEGVIIQDAYEIRKDAMYNLQIDSFVKVNK